MHVISYSIKKIRIDISTYMHSQNTTPPLGLPVTVLGERLQSPECQQQQCCPDLSAGRVCSLDPGLYHLYVCPSHGGGATIGGLQWCTWSEDTTNCTPVRYVSSTNCSTSLDIGVTETCIATSEWFLSLCRLPNLFNNCVWVVGTSIMSNLINEYSVSTETI